MISAPISRVDTPHDVCQTCSCSPDSEEYRVPKTLAKFWPSSWLVPICSALPSPIIPSQVHDVMAPANRSLAVLRPVSTGTASTSTMTSRYTSVKILTDVYREVMVDVLAVPVLTGRKTARERFAGAITSWTCEGMMGDGKALQMGTSHELGQNFAKVFGTLYSSESGEQEHVWQTSWGVSTRLIGALIMAHGDDRGLRLPPRLAPTQVVVVLVRDEEGAGSAATQLVADLKAAGHRVLLDDRVTQAFGRRAVDWELKGVPVRIEVGPRDLAGGNVTLVRRDDGTKRPVALNAAVTEAGATLDSAQAGLLAEATRYREDRTVTVDSLDGIVEAAQSGFAVAPWSVVGEDGEVRLAESGITVRCLQRPDGSLPDASVTGSEDEPDLVAVCGR